MILKNRVIVGLIVAFILTVISSRYLLKHWSSDFELITAESLFTGRVDRYIVNSGYLYIWSDSEKVLVPPARMKDGTPLMNKLRNGDGIIKETKGLELLLLSSQDTLVFMLDKP